MQSHSKVCRLRIFKIRQILFTLYKKKKDFKTYVLDDTTFEKLKISGMVHLRVNGSYLEVVGSQVSVYFLYVDHLHFSQ